MLRFKFISVKFFCYLCLFLVITTNAEANLLLNGDFNTPRSGLSAPNYATSLIGYGANGDSSAQDWNYNSRSNASTELLSTTDPAGTGYMIHVTQDGPSVGIYQKLSVSGYVSASVDIYINFGEVYFALYGSDCCNPLTSMTLNAVGQWQKLNLPSVDVTGMPLTFVVYDNTGANFTTGGDFFVDNAVLTKISEPSTIWLFFSGVLASFCRFKKLASVVQP